MAIVSAYLDIPVSRIEDSMIQNIEVQLACFQIQLPISVWLTLPATGIGIHWQSLGIMIISHVFLEIGIY